MKNNFTPETDLENILLNTQVIQELVIDIRERLGVLLPTEHLISSTHSNLVKLLANEIERKIIKGNDYKISYESLVSYSKFKENFISVNLVIPHIYNEQYISAEDFYKILFIKNIHKEFEEESLNLLSNYKEKNLNNTLDKLVAENEFNEQIKIIIDTYYLKATLNNNNKFESKKTKI